MSIPHVQQNRKVRQTSTTTPFHLIVNPPNSQLTAPCSYGYIPPTIAFALVTFGMVAGAVSSSLYLIDAHRSIAIETFTCLMIFKNIFSFALTFKGYDWLIHNGPKRVFIAVGIVQAVICLLSVPMWVFGKKWREIWGRRDWLGVVGLGARGDI
jgi:hypothetical protein